MGKHVDNFINSQLENLDYLEMLRDEEDFRKAEIQRFSIGLSIFDMRRLVFLCNYLETKRATFAAEAVMSVVNELEERLDLKPREDLLKDFDSLNKMQKEYFTEVLRIGQTDTYTIDENGKVKIVDKNGKKVESNFEYEQEENK